MTPANESTRRIFLIRHARPLVSKAGVFSASDARTFISNYDAAEIEAFVLQHEAIPYQEIKQVYCSTLIRSQLTARAIFGEDVKLIIRHEFREFERRIFSLPYLRLPIRFWLIVARVLWMLGWNSKGIETFRQAKQRARQCAALLAKETETQPTVILVAHGLLNNFIRWYLQKMGWKSALHEGSRFLSVTVMEKK